MSISFLLNPAAESEIEEKKSASYSVIYKNEAEQFFYLVGSQIEDEPGIQIAELLLKCSAFKSIRQLRFVIEQMKEKKLLCKGEDGRGLYVTNTFIRKKNRYEEASKAARPSNRSTITLRDRTDFVYFSQEAIKHIRENSNRITTSKLFTMIDELGFVQLRNLLMKLEKLGNLKKTPCVPGPGYFWSVINEQVVTTQEESFEIARPIEYDELPEKEQKLVDLIYDGPGIAVQKLHITSQLATTTFHRTLKHLLEKNLVQKQTLGIHTYYYPKDFLAEDSEEVNPDIADRSSSPT